MMRKLFTSKEILEACLKNKEDEAKKALEVEKDKDTEEIEEQSANYISREINRTINQAKYNKFRTNVKNYFLVEALSYIFNNSIHMELLNEDNAIIKKNIVNKFVKENNVDELLKSFEDKSILLSELANIITEKYNIVMESIDKNDPETFHVSEDIEKRFFEELNGLDIESAKDVIIDSFIDAEIATMNKYYAKDKILLSSLVNILFSKNQLKYRS